MFAMVSSNLADLMGAIRPRNAQNLIEDLQDGSELSDSGKLESADVSERRGEDQND